ncbi:MAG: efflux RND transporter permease subunit [Candidatus Hydrogenedentes bacterium]|nr:efflux RND transporter permease subunit [Candidatus Hydrogenedentota bacterium]MBI3119641.1 efflux RND transporter permease subunit [Candidatus Hydrogenedentota bacterium]
MTEPHKTPEKQYRLAIRRPVTMAMLFLTMIVFGWRSYQQLPINLMPDISYPTLTVRTEYEGAAPEDVEKLVTRPLEEMLSIVSGVVEISSISSPGLSEVILEFTWGTDMNVAQQDVRDRLDLFEPPNEVTENPVILRYDPTLDPVMRIALTPGAGGLSREEEQRALTAIRDAAERHLKSDLEAEEGIAQVTVKGGREEEIQILVDAQRLKNLGLSLQQVVNALAQQNINLSGGKLEEGRTEYLVRTLNEFRSIEEIGDSLIVMPGGQQVRLKDVADVFLGAKDRETIVHINAHEAVELEIFKEGDANTVLVSDTVKRLLDFSRKASFSERVMTLIKEQSKRVQEARLKASGQPVPPALARSAKRTLLDRLPNGTDRTIITDQARFIVAAINEVKDATIVGGFLALVVLFLFLQEMRSTIIIGISIPISVVAAFVPMYMRDISLNTMSLGGLALGVGMLVDNSIVVLESIFRCKEEGDVGIDAAERGTREVAGAVTASTLTTVAVFFPIAFVEGIAGQLFGDLALTVTFSLLASLLTALYLIPLIYSRRGLQLQAGRQVIWVLRAYHELRAEHGRGPLAALLGAVPLGLQYGAQALRRGFAETVGPTLRALATGPNPSRLHQWAVRGGAFLLLPLVLMLFVLQTLLQVLGVLLITLLFMGCAVLFAVFLVLRWSFNTVLRLPLWLFDRGFTTFRTAYGLSLRHALRFSPVVLLIVLAMAVHAGYLATGLGSELIPPMKQGEFGIRMEAPAGTRLEETEERARRIEGVVRSMDVVDQVTVEIGEEAESKGESDRGENIAEFNVILRNPKETAPIQDQIMQDMRGRIEQVASEEITFTLPTMFSFKTAVELQVFGDDLTMLRKLGQEALAAVQPIPGVKDAELSVKAGYPEILVTLDRELLASKNISAGQVAGRLRTEVQGDIATRFNRSGEKVDMRVRTDRRLLSSVEDLKRISITDGFPPIPLEDVATIEEQEGPSEIRRIAQRQVVLVTANVADRDLGAVSADIEAAVAKIAKPEDYEFVLGGQNRELETSYASLRFALLLAIFLVYVVMACQFESIWHPALVMFSVPLAFVGVVYALVATHLDLSIMVFLGAIVLAGIVVNNAIVLVDYINQLRARGRAKADAIVEAGMVRLRPIFMTTITTVLGLLPMITASGEGAEMRRPMAITVMAGLTCSTLLTLVVIPMLYHLFGGRDKA